MSDQEIAEAPGLSGGDGAPVESTPVDTDAEMGAVFDRLMTNNGADRGPDGRFASTKAEEAPAAELEPDAEAGQAEPEGDDGAQDAAPAPEPVSAPAHLPEAIKSVWADMPETAQKAVAAHQADIDKKFGEQGRVLGAMRPVAETIFAAAARHPEFRGMTPEQIAQGAVSLADVQARMERDPVATTLQVIEQYGVADQIRAKLSDAPPSDAGQVISELRQEIAELKRSAQHSADPEYIQQHVSHAFENQKTQQAVSEFAASQPHFADVEQALPGFIEIARKTQPDAAPMELLKAAYDMAVHAIPDVRAKIAAAETKAADPDPARTEQAKRAASVNVKSKSTGKERIPTEHESMGAAYDRAMGR